ncbi:Ku protein [Desulfallas thermosapovorans]|uniref:Non-homologous end joining protein Ku n=1 Tax=Desulfallas thermosapovorans DSM 6562 TaxID=1121431 RepID=A0A5S5A0U7_9FIRM|nr:Ku protein [Desulfallas thermosapovorans]TYO97917.1 DNA end-binding protein Ku [Desulfallas thermosapovorans DSM 6562]
MHALFAREGERMRALWKGAITFGLIYVPVKMYAATEKKDVKFNYLHAPCHTPLRYVRYCPHCAAEVKTDEIVRGYEYEKGQYITVTEDELAGLSGDKNRSVDIIDFVDLQQIDPVYFDRSYYLGPGEGGKKVYELLRQAMQQTSRAAIALITIRNRESLAVIRPTGQALVMETMFYADEVRAVEQVENIGGQVNLHENEVKMAVNLIDNLSTDFEPVKYTSTYREKLHEMIRAKIAGEAVLEKPAAPATENVVDLMAALKASIEMAKEERGNRKKRQVVGKGS